MKSAKNVAMIFSLPFMITVKAFELFIKVPMKMIKGISK